ncbi:hypothetical protein DYI23_03565 [Roseibium polysiphoniae]|uniref:Uncharacterized protein n=1 Tax=Roseibium polysiphoniae TaxID=2571221 RepID=A0A944C8W2_9HYPH|nr:hypothetical protein [Roseibium polysiphoniae]MBS8259290.1 hypothetical protein [Roseibium polysiphoniae]
MRIFSSRFWVAPALLCLGLTLAGCAGQANGDANGWYDGSKGLAPKANRIYVCHGFGCAYKTPVDFSARDLSRLRSILASGRRSPAGERRAIAKAVQWQERRVAGAVGSAKDVGGLDMQNAGVRGQMDCIDESTNTNSLLLVAQRHGYLKHHTVSSPVARGFFLDGRYPHATATVREKKSGKVYAVDSWPDSNGKPPRISELSVWMSQRSG